MKFGVKPKSLPDYFGLVGDRADNIPGEKVVTEEIQSCNGVAERARVLVLDLVSFVRRDLRARASQDGLRCHGEISR